MCGIVGLLRRGVPPSELDLLRVSTMRDLLAHRGPDDRGIESIGPCVLGHRRLSVVDLAGGHQPMGSADGRIWVAFNGEIYNHAALRSELEAAGRSFRTRSDTEILIHLYAEEGIDFLGRLEGMYALALWDAHEQRLLLARDPMGQKPLYWTDTGERLLFGSELRALLAHPDVPRRIDRSGLRLYLRHDCVPAPWSIYKGIHKLEPGVHLLFDAAGGRPRRGRHHRLPLDRDALGDLPLAEGAEALWPTLVRAVERRLMADVPLGVFLSGGLDSTLLVAAMAECMEASRIRTFTVGFRERSYDESGAARCVAEHFGTRHEEEMLDPEAALDALPQVLGHLDEPFADPSILPTWLLSRFTRAHVTVALGGDGGDELFCGYPTFVLDRTLRPLLRHPRMIPDRLLARLAALLPGSDANMSPRFLAERLSGGLSAGWPHAHFAWITGVDPRILDLLLVPELRGDATSPHDDSFAAVERNLSELETGSRGPTNLLCGLYARLYLAPCVLQKVDRASMAHGLEARAPLLDREVVAAAWSTSTAQRVRGRVTKRLLRQIARQRGIPRWIERRPKKGFGIPVAAWLRGPLRQQVENLLLGPSADSGGVLNRSAVRMIWEEHISGRRDRRKDLWSLLAYRIWERGPWGPESRSEPGA